MRSPINVLTDYIQDYESDTFSAEDSKLTFEESQKLAEFFIARDFAKMADNIDGLQLDEVLGWLRNKELKNEDFELKEL